MADKRKYEKRDMGYWNRHSSSPQTAASTPADPFPTFKPKPFPDIAYGTRLESHGASSSGGAPDTLTRDAQLNSSIADPGAYQNLKALPNWFVSAPGGDYASVSEAIRLCIKAWAGIAVCRNAIEVAVEFSSQPLWIKCSNQTVLTFFREWFELAGISGLVPQCVRAYLREGAFYLYRLEGQFGPAYYEHFQNAFGAKENRIPIRYEVMNPMNVYVPNGLTYPYSYVRLLSSWEAERLRNPITEQDKQVFNDLPATAKQQIHNGSGADGVYIPLDPKRLRFAFYKKQNWEPFGVPALWPVLADVEWKLTLKKMDKQLARTMEHAILLVTNGEAPSKENGGNGINPNNIARLQSLFSNHTIGRVLVADYTTKAQWLIPDIQSLLGPEKYKIANEDIKEGLQSILMGEDKFANAQMKAKIFVQRLVEGQNVFLRDFLMPEVRTICERMGFRTIPKIGFQKINLDDPIVAARIYAQLAQIGALTPEQAIKAMETQILPDGDELVAGQEETKKLRDKGLFKPLIGGEKEGPEGRPGGTSGIKQSGTRRSAPIGVRRAAEEEDAFDADLYPKLLVKSQVLTATVEKALRKKHSIDGAFNDTQNQIVHALVNRIVATEEPAKWLRSVASAIKNPPAISPELGNELDDISLTYSEPGYEIDEFDAALLRHCRVEPPERTAA